MLCESKPSVLPSVLPVKLSVVLHTVQVLTVGMATLIVQCDCRLRGNQSSWSSTFRGCRTFRTSWRGLGRQLHGDLQLSRASEQALIVGCCLILRGLHTLGPKLALIVIHLFALLQI